MSEKILVNNFADALRLTQTVSKGGCAAKVPAIELRKILSQVKFSTPGKNVIVDGSTFDDAGVIKIAKELALVQTLDFFTPIVDSPKLYGQIASANALSDIYAMGGTPISAMAILGFPVGKIENKVITEIIQGSVEKVEESRADFIGGHSIDDDVLKFGLSVTGIIHPDRVWKNSGAQIGDVLILTKKLGTGTLTSGLKKGIYTESQIQEALISMTKLNSVPEVLGDLGLFVSAATDITGFGLAGHCLQLAKASNVSLEITIDSVPFFDQVPESISNGNLTKAHRTNFEYVNKETNINEITEWKKLAFCDPQTSGGLLMVVPEDKLKTIMDCLENKFPEVKQIGRVLESGNSFINFV